MGFSSPAISDVFEWDKANYIKKVYLTERTDHPGADMVLKGDADKTHLIGGTIHVLPQPKNPSFGKYVLSPREVRALIIPGMNYEVPETGCDLPLSPESFIDEIVVNPFSRKWFIDAVVGVAVRPHGIGGGAARRPHRVASHTA